MASTSAPLINRDAFMELALTFGVERRFTQDTPVMAEVWTKYACAPSADGREDLIITAHNRSSSFEVASAIAGSLGTESAVRQARIAALRNDIAASLTFEQLILHALPLTAWWQDRFAPPPLRKRGLTEDSTEKSVTELLTIYESLGVETRNQSGGTKLYDVLNSEGVLKSAPERDKWHVLILIVIVSAANSLSGLSGPKRKAAAAQIDALIAKINRREASVSDCAMLWTSKARALLEALSAKRLERPEDGNAPPSIFNINLNRPFSVSTHVSRQTIKADAAERLFEQDTSRITWAIIDSGIDAAHRAFVNRAPGGGSRVLKAYDFRRMRELISLGGPGAALEAALAKDPETAKKLGQLKQDIIQGRQLDWTLLGPLLEIDPATAPPHPHGTHVAGILGGNLRAGEAENFDKGALQGICPDIRFYDLRVCDESGGGEEFVIIAALQFLSHVNRHKDEQKVHGANLSLSIRHEVANYACGQTPVCIQANQLAADGVVVVAAAGNQGYQKFATEKGVFETYSAMNITDPGNADGVITVGSTHREKPHAYGVSYFSSRGPTGDGRMKPDILAPGERISAPVPGGGVEKMDGTSMAAPHVSGAAAMLIARHKELRRNPQRIKQILCATATDLGRERSFQGAGLVDILRAMQSV